MNFHRGQNVDVLSTTQLRPAKDPDGGSQRDITAQIWQPGASTCRQPSLEGLSAAMPHRLDPDQRTEPSENTTPGQPRNAPMAAMNFTSPKPIASRGKITSSVVASRYGTVLGVQRLLADAASFKRD